MDAPGPRHEIVSTEITYRVHLTSYPVIEGHRPNYRSTFDMTPELLSATFRNGKLIAVSLRGFRVPKGDKRVSPWMRKITWDLDGRESDLLWSYAKAPEWLRGIVEELKLRRESGNVHDNTNQEGSETCG